MARWALGLQCLAKQHGKRHCLRVALRAAAPALQRVLLGTDFQHEAWQLYASNVLRFVLDPTAGGKELMGCYVMGSAQSAT